MIDAKEKDVNKIILWGTGKATRDFLYVQDAAEGILLAMEHYNKANPVNLASGREISIKELSKIVSNEIGFNGNILWDTSKPDGQPRRLFDISRARQEFGFSPSTSFDEGLNETINWYMKNRYSD
jgi:GDP-L-fucose synthase